MSYKNEINLLPASIKLRGRRICMAALQVAAALIILLGAAYAMLAPLIREGELESGLGGIRAQLAQYDIPSMQAEQESLGARYDAYLSVGGDGVLTYSAMLEHVTALLADVRLAGVTYSGDGYADIRFEADSISLAMDFLKRLSEDKSFPVMRFSDVSLQPGGTATVTVSFEPAEEGGAAK